MGEGIPQAERERMAETIRMIVTSRERAPRSPRLERALKRLIWRYSRVVESETQQSQKSRVAERGLGRE